MSNKHFWRKVIPVALTILGSASTVAAVIFAAKEGPKYKAALEERGEDMKPVEKVTTAVKIFAPAIGCAAVSVACGVGAHVMDMHTQASLTGAYAALSAAYTKYRKKNETVNGPEADLNVMREFMTEKIRQELGLPAEPDNDDAAQNGQPDAGGNDPSEKTMKFYDHVTGITFESTLANVIQAEYYVNKFLQTTGAVTMDEWCDLLGISKVPEGGESGWSTEMLASDWFEFWLDFNHYPVKDADGSDMIEIAPDILPDVGYLSDYGC